MKQNERKDTEKACFYIYTNFCKNICECFKAIERTCLTLKITKGHNFFQNNVSGVMALVL